MNLTIEELQKLKQTQSEQQWNAVCDEIKSARDGSYPPDWYAVVLGSGLMNQISAAWGN